jgi:cytochrome c-type biogenesis protein
MEAKIPLAFVAGLFSFVTPCVLPLVPGYLSAVSGARPGETGGRVVAASMPFLAGFTLVFVALGAAAGALGSAFGENQQLLLHVAGVVIVILGFAMMGLLPFPYFDRLAAPELVEGARRRGSGVLLGGTFALCAAPCVGPVLASILLLATDTGTVGQASFLLLVYSVGLAVPFLLVGVAFGRTMQASRWLRDHYDVMRIASGAILVAIGLLLFFDRFWWLNVAVNRAFQFLGIRD